MSNDFVVAQKDLLGRLRRLNPANQAIAVVAVATLALVNANIVVVASAIGATTFLLATAGLLIGRAAGSRFGPLVEVIGGVGLITIGLGVLLEHTGVIG